MQLPPSDISVPFSVYSLIFCWLAFHPQLAELFPKEEEEEV
jgi:hypothetical protein